MSSPASDDELSMEESKSSDSLHKNKKPRWHWNLPSGNNRDLVLLNAAHSQRIWTVEHNHKRATWNVIAKEVDSQAIEEAIKAHTFDEKTWAPANGRGCQKHYHEILAEVDDKDKTAAQRSGDSEQYGERERLALLCLEETRIHMEHKEKLHKKQQRLSEQTTERRAIHLYSDALLMSDDTSLSLFKLDDFHLHLRDGAVLTHTANTAAQHTHYATIMPNTQPPITNTKAAIDYRHRIFTAINNNNNNNNNNKNTTFTPLMTLYLTDITTPEEIHTAKQSGVIYACKLYPAGATTHSQQGVSMHDDAALRRLHDTFEAMAECGLLLLIHGEITDQQVDIFDRESVFLTRYLAGLLSAHPTLRIVLEHITTAEAVSFVQSCTSPNLAATITAHHLLYNRNALFTGGLNPHNYCLPVLKAEHHRLALLSAATSQSDKFFAGTDSAPHSAQRKRDEGCAGCYTAFAALELYATAFESVGKLDVLQAFCCERGRAFYRLPHQDDRHRERVQLVRSEWTIPEKLPFGNEYVVPFMAGNTLKWKVKQQESEHQ